MGSADAVADQVSLGELVERYARRLIPAVGTGQRGSSVFSALGIWLLLAVCLGAADPERRRHLEEVVGCEATQAAALVEGFFGAPPPSLAAAGAVWAHDAAVTEALLAFCLRLPRGIAGGTMPEQAQADEWTKEQTLGLLDRFPVALDDTSRLVLASVLAAKTAWRQPFSVVPADTALGPESPWRGQASELLADNHPEPNCGLMSSQAAGLVAVHVVSSEDGLSVVSVSAEERFGQEAVAEAALEVVASLSGRPSGAAPRSLFDVALGEGHSFELSEQEIAAQVEGRIERVERVVLPAWRAETNLELLASPAFGVAPALEALQGLLDPGPLAGKARQTAVASFNRFGFEAAAVTVFGATGLAPPPQLRHRGVLRLARLRFDHPYAVVATDLSPGAHAGVPLFSAWVAEPAAVDPEPSKPGPPVPRRPPGPPPRPPAPSPSPPPVTDLADPGTTLGR